MHLKPENVLARNTSQHLKISYPRTQSINSAVVPIGYMPEEAKNKNMNKFREHITRKTSSQLHDRFIDQPINIFRPFYFNSKKIIEKTQNFPSGKSKTEFEISK